MKTRILTAAVLIALLVAWSASDAGAQACTDDSDPVPGGTSESVDFAGVVPGSMRQWPMTVTNSDDQPAALRASIRGTGVLSAALLVGLSTCEEAWDPPTGTVPAHCPTGATVALAPTTAAGELEVDLTTLAPGAEWYGMFSAVLPITVGNEYQGTTGSIRSLVLWNAVCGPTTTVPTTAPPPSAPPATTPPGGDVPTSGVPTTVPTLTATPDGPRNRPPSERTHRPTRLPYTGSAAMGLLVGVGMTLLAGGTSVLAAQGRRREDTDDTPS